MRLIVYNQYNRKIINPHLIVDTTTTTAGGRGWVPEKNVEKMWKVSAKYRANVEKMYKVSAKYRANEQF